MDDKEKLSVSIYYMFEAFRDTLSLPTDATLEKSMKFSALLFVCSGISQLLGFYTFISWQGALLCTVILIGLLWVERRENDALLRMYRNARLSAKKAAQRAKDASASYSSGRRPTGDGAGQQKVGKGNRRTNNGSNKRRNGSAVGSKSGKGRPRPH